MSIQSTDLSVSAETQWVGIDVCKRWLDVYLRPSGENFRVSNSHEGIEALTRRLARPSQVGRIIVEATGGYERQFALEA